MGARAERLGPSSATFPNCKKGARSGHELAPILNASALGTVPQCQSYASNHVGKLGLHVLLPALISAPALAIVDIQIVGTMDGNCL